MCKVGHQSIEEMKLHLQGKLHEEGRKRYRRDKKQRKYGSGSFEGDPKTSLYCCDVCNTGALTYETAAIHLDGKVHKMAVFKLVGFSGNYVDATEKQLLALDKYSKPQSLRRLPMRKARREYGVQQRAEERHAEPQPRGNRQTSTLGRGAASSRSTQQSSRDYQRSPPQPSNVQSPAAARSGSDSTKSLRPPRTRVRIRNRQRFCLDWPRCPSRRCRNLHPPEPCPHGRDECRYKGCTKIHQFEDGLSEQLMYLRLLSLLLAKKRNQDKGAGVKKPWVQFIEWRKICRKWSRKQIKLSDDGRSSVLKVIKRKRVYYATILEECGLARQNLTLFRLLPSEEWLVGLAPSGDETKVCRWVYNGQSQDPNNKKRKVCETSELSSQDKESENVVANEDISSVGLDGAQTASDNVAAVEENALSLPDSSETTKVSKRKLSESSAVKLEVKLTGSEDVEQDYVKEDELETETEVASADLDQTSSSTAAHKDGGLKVLQEGQEKDDKVGKVQSVRVLFDVVLRMLMQLCWSGVDKRVSHNDNKPDDIYDPELDTREALDQARPKDRRRGYERGRDYDRQFQDRGAHQSMDSRPAVGSQERQESYQTRTDPPPNWAPNLPPPSLRPASAVPSLLPGPVYRAPVYPLSTQVSPSTYPSPASSYPPPVVLRNPPFSVASRAPFPSSSPAPFRPSVLHSTIPSLSPSSRYPPSYPSSANPNPASHLSSSVSPSSHLSHYQPPPTLHYPSSPDPRNPSSVAAPRLPPSVSSSSYTFPAPRLSPSSGAYPPSGSVLTNPSLYQFPRPRVSVTVSPNPFSVVSRAPLPHYDCPPPSYHYQG
eukprot:gb/GEZN01001838.1/.p1 GENE.gb/GEZN01001838.1/~~gb/GEZN01001838.1/.p1  ORF type:complete len:876 (-),score=111.36 gb/GEZN01001838.1/:166-2646(-)